MIPVIDPNFSVFQLVQRVQSDGMLLSHRRTMSMVSYEIENASLIDGAHNRIFSSFQYMSKFIPQIARYTQIAMRAESVYVFGVPDISLPTLPNITYIPLKPTDQLAKEWFLVSYGREYCSALGTEEQSQFHDPDDSRVFKGSWSFDKSMVNILHDWLSSAVDTPLLNIEQNDHDYVRQVTLMSNTLHRFSERLIKQQQRKQTAREMQALIDTSLKSASEAVKS
mgnify:CR=1 FL=1